MLCRIRSKQGMWNHKSRSLLGIGPVQNDRGMMIYAVVANGCSHNNRIRHVIAKKHLHCSRKTVFYAVLDEMLQLG